MKRQADMFPEIADCLSPRLLWLRDNDVHTYETPGLASEAWSAWTGDLDDSISAGGDNPEAGGYAKGDNEEEAIVNLAKARKIPLWNESEYAGQKEKIKSLARDKTSA